MEEILTTYCDALDLASEQMLVAAKQENWSEVIRLEVICLELIAKIQERVGIIIFTKDEMREKFQRIYAILLRESSMRNLAEQFQNSIDRMLTEVPSGVTIH